MYQKRKNTILLAAWATSLSLALGTTGQIRANELRVTITNNSPAGGVSFTPVWVGFHNGSFDSYNGGLGSQEGLQRIAEDGNAAVISADFLGGYTYIDNSGASPASARILSSQPGAERIDGLLGSAPIGPGQTAMRDFTIQPDGSQQYFSYVSMILPSNDYYIANGDPMGVDLSTLFGAAVGTSLSFDIGLPGSINDAGTEVNFANISGPGDTLDETVAGLGLLGAAYVGQASPNVGADQNGVNTAVINAYAEAPSILADHPALDFNDPGLYPNGIATVTISTVPEPATGLSFGLALVGLSAIARRRRRTGSSVAYSDI